jgi:peptidoglycan/xylan/chitin deacetylase (PgdA/CDA1 family)
MAGEPTAPWPGGCRGAVSLTFDDGMPSQIQKAAPILQEAGLRATFYVNPRDSWLAGAADWRTLVQAGHEIGNHTITHPCSRALIDDPGIPCLECLSLEDLEAEILEASGRLRTAFPEQAEFTFCYPCYHEHVGAGATRRSYVPLIARHFLAARGRGERGYNHPVNCDLAYLYSWNVEFATGAYLVGRAQEAASLGRWTIFTIHGIDEGHLALAEVALRELVDFLSWASATIWTAPVVEVARRIADWRAVTREGTGACR